jgi:hypothetical protein
MFQVDGNRYRASGVLHDNDMREEYLTQVGIEQE